MTKPPDILEALRAAAEIPAELTPEQISLLLRNAAEVIETLRLLVDIREDGEAQAELKAKPPAGHG